MIGLFCDLVFMFVFGLISVFMLVVCLVLVMVDWWLDN